MALRAILDKLDDVAEAQRALYVARDGKYVLDVDPDSAEEAFASGLKRNRDDTLRELAAAKKKLAAWDGVDPEEYRKLRSAADEAERKKAAAEGDFKSLEKQLIDRHNAELEGRDTKIGKLTAALEKRLVQAKLQAALSKANARPTMLDLLVLDGSRHIRVRETGDDFEEFVADEKGTPLVADGKGTPMTVEMFVEQRLKTKYPDAFLGSGSSGGGASKSTGGAGGGSVIPAGDGKAFIANLDKIAKGEVQVQ